MSSSSIAHALREQRARLEAAARAAGRDPASVRLLAVSKRHPAAALREAYAAGQRDFGENYVQEMVEKAAELRDLPELRFHLIGHLQRNKARHVVGIARALHAVDDVRLVAELDKRLAARAATLDAGSLETGVNGGVAARLDVFVEVNVSGEPSKSGCHPDAASAVIDAVTSSAHLRAVGLMTLPPAADDPEEARPHFEALARLRDHLGGPTRLPELSMGMSHDADVAVACGATWVRVGTAIFGARGGA